MFYYTYVLQSLKDSKFYAGYTENLKLRFEEHQKGRVISTKNRRPLKLIYYEACLNKKDAMHREKYFKTYLGKMFIKSRLKSYLTGCSILQLHPVKFSSPLKMEKKPASLDLTGQVGLR